MKLTEHHQSFSLTWRFIIKGISSWNQHAFLNNVLLTEWEIHLGFKPKTSQPPIPPAHLCQHLTICICYKIPSANKQKRSSEREVWCNSLLDLEKVNEIDLEHIIDETNVNVSWQSAVFNVMNECIPRKILPRKKHLPWITPSIHGPNKCCLTRTNEPTFSSSWFNASKLDGKADVLQVNSKCRLKNIKTFQNSYEGMFYSFSICTRIRNDHQVNRLETATVRNKYFFNNFIHAYTSADYSWLHSALTLLASTQHSWWISLHWWTDSQETQKVLPTTDPY